MAHPDRSAQAKVLAESLSDLPVRVCFDPDPEGPWSTVRTARRAWHPWLPSATHHLVLQDDASPCRYFASEVRAAVASQPTSALSYHTEWGSHSSFAVRLAAMSNRPWVDCTDKYFPTITSSLPVALASDLVDYLGQTPGTTDDHEVFNFLRLRGVPSLISVPNLTDHDGDVSVAGNHRFGRRRASLFLGEMRLGPSWWARAPLSPVLGLPSSHWWFGDPHILLRASRDLQAGVMEPLERFAKLIDMSAVDDVISTLRYRCPSVWAAVPDVERLETLLQALALLICMSRSILKSDAVLYPEMVLAALDSSEGALRKSFPHRSSEFHDEYRELMSQLWQVVTRNLDDGLIRDLDPSRFVN